MEPRPVDFFSNFGPAPGWRAGVPWINAHPTTRLRFPRPAGRHRLVTMVVIAAAAYAASADPNQPPPDGVEIQLTAREGGVVPRIPYERLLNPFRNAVDRGEQAMDAEFELVRPAQVDLFFGPGPQGRDTDDWISLGRVGFE